MTGTMTWAAMDVHARSIYAASLDVMSGELTRQRFDTGAVEPVVGWLAGLPGPVRACYEAGPTGFGLYRAARAAGIDCQVIAPSKTPRPSGDRNKSDRWRDLPAHTSVVADRSALRAVPVRNHQQGHRPGRPVQAMVLSRGIQPGWKRTAGCHRMLIVSRAGSLSARSN